MEQGNRVLLLFSNPVVVAGFWGWFTAQSLKVLVGVFREKRFNFKWFVGSGGMPSSHAAMVMALTVAVGIREGFGTSLFAACMIFAFITMFDAQGVRRQSGKQAEALNEILDDIYSQRGIQPEPLKELFGHTPVEVLAGGVIGAAVAALVI